MMDFIPRDIYRKTSNTSRILSPNFSSFLSPSFSSSLAVVSAQSIEASCAVENEDVVGATPTGDAPTASEWSTILLLTKVKIQDSRFKKFLLSKVQAS